MMKLRSSVAGMGLVVVLVAAGGCSSADTSDPRHFEFDESASGLSKGTVGAQNGDLDYCTGGSLCTVGEGDCDGDAECTAGLVCGYDNGPNFGMPGGWDACVIPTCRNGVQDNGETGIDCGTADCGVCPVCPLAPPGSASYCSTTCPCSAGGGDCDANNECTSGLVCARLGTQFGMPFGHDVCVESHCANGIQDSGETGIDCGGSDCGTCTVCPGNGTANTCSPTCPCSAGWGDCDGDRECQTGLVCGNKNGAQFGSSAFFDYCVVPHCQNGIQENSLGETGLDCGGECGTCNFGSTPAQSCTGGLDICGATGSENCCSSPSVPLSTYLRNYDGVLLTDSTNKSATVSKYNLDKFEVTVGRFRTFVSAYDTWRGGGNPTVGSGANPRIAGSGWDAAFVLPADSATLTTDLNCGTPTWTGSPAGNEAKAINCVNWATAFAFCIWDNGRLPTEAEWNAAAAGGSEQRVYPWSSPPSSTTISSTYAVYNNEAVQKVGARLPGAGRWSHMDLSGSMWEWTLDYYASTLQSPCVNCAALTLTPQAWRVIRGGSWVTSNTGNLAAGFRTLMGQTERHIHVGFRCARD